MDPRLPEARSRSGCSSRIKSQTEVRTHLASGFSLVELLTVISIIGFLAVLSMPSISSLLRASRINTAVNALDAALQTARSHAISRNTYVWVGLRNEPSGSDAITALLVAGTTGESSDLAEGSAAPLQKPIHLAGVELVERTPPPGGEADAVDVVGAELADFDYSWIVAGRSMDFPYVIRFDPRGIASVRSETLDKVLQLNLRPLPARSGEGNLPTLQLHAISGALANYR